MTLSVGEILKAPVKLTLRRLRKHLFYPPKKALSIFFNASKTVKKRTIVRSIRGIKMQADDIVVLAVVKNEALRLPYFLEYYLQLGITKFVILDHGSTDQTAQIVDAEPTAIRIPVKGNFVYKSTWMNAVLETLCQDKWVLALDADEFLVYPHMDLVDLRSFLSFLDARGEDAVSSKLLDMYPKGNIWDLQYKPGQNPLEVAPYFDMNAMTRARVFGVAPYLEKVPLFRFDDSKFLGAGQHVLAGARISNVRGCLLHFKFLQDFKDKTSSNAILRYFDRSYGRQLAAYSAHIEASDGLELYSEDSAKYVGPEQLVDCGFMATTPEWEQEVDAHDLRCEDRPIA